jgi:alpha-tubulin suppressor-like RCC1 family protein
VGENVAQIATGFAHTCAVLENGNVRCWGESVYGVLGYGNSNSNEIGDDETPASVADVDVGGSVAQIAAGTFHTCVLLTNGSVRCWGWGRYGQLGYGNDDNIGDDETPASAGDVEVGGSVAQIAAGSDHTCALLTNGNVRCWGGATDGALGHADRNDIGDDEAPANAGDVEVGGSVAQIAAGDAHTCALLRNGKVRCWGWSAQGQLGYGNRDDVGDGKTPASAGDVDVGGSVTQLATGYASTCALLANGSVRCWGAGAFGLGYGDTESIGDDEAPASAGDIDVGGPVTRIAVGGHACALFASGSVRCWGVGGSGQLGYGSTENIGDDETPASAGDVPYL